MLADLIADLARRNAAINNLRAGRREQDAELLRQELDSAKLGVLSLGQWLPNPQTMAGGDVSGSDHHFEASIVASGPLIVNVDVFG